MPTHGNTEEKRCPHTATLKRRDAESLGVLHLNPNPLNRRHFEKVKSNINSLPTGYNKRDIPQNEITIIFPLTASVIPCKVSISNYHIFLFV